MVTTVTKYGTWKGIFGRRSDLVRGIADDLRALVLGLHSDAVEVPRKDDKLVGYGFGEKKVSDTYCTIAPQSGHVNLGLPWGAVLDDPNGLLTGKGKRLRHVKIESRATACSAKIAHLVHQAIDERRSGESASRTTSGTKAVAAGSGKEAN